MNAIIHFGPARSLTLLACAASLSVTAVASGQTYLGADAALRQLDQAAGKAPQSSAPTNRLAILRADLKALRNDSTKLPPAEAAKDWLDLVDRAANTGGQTVYGMSGQDQPIEPNELFEALPPPTAWHDLVRLVAERPKGKGAAELTNIGLRFLAATLIGDNDASKREIASLQAAAKGADIFRGQVYRNFLEQLSQAILESSTDPDAILTSLSRQIRSGDGGNRRPVSVPNLVPQIGAEKTSTFLREALAQPGITLQFENANETSRLAQKIALEMIDKLQTPQWGLINSLDAVNLYEAMQRRFPAPTNQAAVAGTPESALPDASLPPDPGMNSQGAAQLYYLLGLIAADRPNDAAALAKSVGGSLQPFEFDAAFKQMERAGYTKALDNFLYELLSQDPGLPFWSQYVDLSAKSGATERMLTLARAAAANSALGDDKRASIDEILYKAFLAADHVDEAVQEIHRLLTLGAPPASRLGFGQFDPEQTHDQLGITLARVGLLLQKPEWVQEGIAEVKKQFQQTSAPPQPSYGLGSTLDSAEEILFKANQGPEAESLLLEALAASARQPAQPSFSWGGASPGAQSLTVLALLYHQAGRQSDVLAVFERFPQWGVADLANLSETVRDEEAALMFLHTGSSVPPVSYLAADALIAASRNADAAKIVDDLLLRQPGLDRGYELLLRLQGSNAIPRLDAMFLRDRFEERPLIWKAHLLRLQNDLPEAEKIARQAIAIDPSDGEEGRGDRMRAYAELADIRDAQGEKKDADFYRQIVQSIRMSEDADEFYKAGLLKRAIPMYEEALTHFADAYCIQSRLAIQLAALGQNDAAEEHYRRAYELMPDSFGRVESHCFGCERAFDGERAQSIAEKVFSKLVIDRPDKPQVRYLLGYLRQEQERYSESRTNYEAATQLDPDYLNAWVKLNEVADHVSMPPQEHDGIVFNILRLDPLQRHTRVQFRRVSNLAGLWNAVAATASFQHPFATNLLSLTASKAALEKIRLSPEQEMEKNAMRSALQDISGNSSLAPGAAVGQTAFVSLAGQIITQSSAFGGE